MSSYNLQLIIRSFVFIGPNLTQKSLHPTLGEKLKNLDYKTTSVKQHNNLIDDLVKLKYFKCKVHLTFS